MKYKNTIQKDYENLIPTIKYLALAAQFLSGSTAAFGIYVVIIQKIPISVKAVSVMITLVLTFIIIGSFEGGIRKLFPYWVRQILSWCLNDNQENKKQKSIRLVLFSMLCILLMPLVIGTSISSWNASPDLISFTSAKPEVQDLNCINENLEDKSNQLLEQFNKDLKQDSILFRLNSEALKTSWNAKIEAQEIQRIKYLNLSAKGHEWAAGSAAKIKNKVIPELKTKKAEALQALHTKRVTKLDSLRMHKSTTLLLQQQSKNNLLQDAKEHNDLLLQEANQSLSKWGQFLAVLAIVSTFFTLFCFTFIEAYKAAAIHLPAHKPNPHKASTTKLDANVDTPVLAENLVAHGTLPFEVTHKITKNMDFVSIDKLIKRTRMQWQRSLDTNKEREHRATNRKKAEENIEFLRSIGISVSIDESDNKKLVISRKEIA